MSALGPDRPEYGLSRGRIDRGRRARAGHTAHGGRLAGRDARRAARDREKPRSPWRARDVETSTLSSAAQGAAAGTRRRD